MRVLVVHNRYRSAQASGENHVVDDEIEGLRAAGVEVETYLPSSDDIEGMGVRSRTALAVRPIFSLSDAMAVGRILERAKPDVVHVHNVFPLLSPAVVRVARRRGLPVVHTVHNYRRSCVAGIHHRDGRSCEDCRGSLVPWPAVRHACYRGSRAQSAVMGAAQVVHAPTWGKVTRHIAISDHVAAYLRTVGVPPERITVKPNGVADPGPVTPPGRGFLYAGRLDEAKGTRLLLDAWAAAGLPGDRQPIAGDGPLRPLVGAAAEKKGSIRYLGLLSRDEVAHAIRSSAAVVVPSTWPEPFSLAAVEAMSHARPVVATRVGNLSDLVSPGVGWSAEPTVDGLAGVLRQASEASDHAIRGRAGRAVFDAGYTPAATISRLIGVYEEVLGCGAGSAGGPAAPPGVGT